jgi:hypothetical protein
MTVLHAPVIRARLPDRAVTSSELVERVPLGLRKSRFSITSRPSSRYFSEPGANRRQAGRGRPFGSPCCSEGNQVTGHRASERRIVRRSPE